MEYFVPFLIALFAIAALLQIDFYFTIVYLLVAAYVLSRLWLQQTTRRLELRRRFTDHAFCGDWVTVHLMLHNKSRLPIPWLQLHESLPAELAARSAHQEVISMKGQEKQRIAYSILCNKRGYYPIGPLKSHAGDLLGLIPSVEMEKPAQHIIVYPRVVPLEALGLPTHSPLVALPARTPLFEDPARIMGVRDYQRGDSPRRIHWTATASAGKLLVKRYQPAIARETLIGLDLAQDAYGQRQRYTATELAIVVAASIANHIAVREKLPVGLVTKAHDPLSGEVNHFYIPPRRERSHLIHLLEVLARAQVAPTTPLSEVLRRESVRLSWGATILAITGRESADLFDTLVYLQRAGFSVALVLVQPAQPSAELQERSSILDVPVHRIWQERDLELWQ